MFDTIIRGGTVVDGTGAAPVAADIAIVGGRIVAIAPAIEGTAVEVIDASERLVTPGFIDIHTHYDGQATWDSELNPSAGHGITTVLIGCCGIGFAPVRKGQEDWLIKLTEGVEDIPGTALHVGIPWGWETFADYLDHLGGKQYSMDIAAHVPHSALRAYVLGEKAQEDMPAEPAELESMASHVREAIGAGAFGFATSRVSMHRGSDGGVLPGTCATEEELIVLARAVRDGGGGVLQFIPSGISGGVEGEGGEHMLAGATRDKYRLTEEIDMFRRIHKDSGQPITFLFAECTALGDVEYGKSQKMIEDIKANGERIHPQYSPRCCGGLLSLKTYHPFMARPTYAKVAELPLAERVTQLQRADIKAAILGESDVASDSTEPFGRIHETFQKNLDSIFSLQNLDYEPAPERSVAAIAAAEGREPLDVCYDMLLEQQGGANLIWFSTGYLDGDLRKKEQCIEDSHYVMGIGDAGAHVQFICDASFPTFLLSHWGKDRTRGRRFSIEFLVQKITADAANLYGMSDRGTLEIGKRADINIIDFANLSIDQPALVQDLPANATRFIQTAKGYDLTMVGGVVTRRNGQDTGARPGRLYRRGRDQGESLMMLESADARS